MYYQDVYISVQIKKTACCTPNREGNKGVNVMYFFQVAKFLCLLFLFLLDQEFENEGEALFGGSTFTRKKFVKVSKKRNSSWFQLVELLQENDHYVGFYKELISCFFSADERCPSSNMVYKGKSRVSSGDEHIAKR